jgi:chromate transporter
VGVIASLAVFFTIHTLFDDTDRVTTGPFDFEIPVLDSVQWTALAITALAVALIFGGKWSPLRTLGVCALVGVCAGLATSLA